jgi:hypothetical protein
MGKSRGCQLGQCLACVPQLNRQPGEMEELPPITWLDRHGRGRIRAGADDEAEPAPVGQHIPHIAFGGLGRDIEIHQPAGNDRRRIAFFQTAPYVGRRVIQLENLLPRLAEQQVPPAHHGKGHSRCDDSVRRRGVASDDHVR